MPNDDSATANITCTVSGTASNMTFAFTGDYVDPSTGNIDFSNIEKKVNVTMALNNLVAGTTLTFDTSNPQNNFWVCPQASGKPTAVSNTSDDFKSFNCADSTHLSFVDKNSSNPTKQYYDYMVRVQDQFGTWYNSDPTIVNR
jgi:hypothetical protein